MTYSPIAKDDSAKTAIIGAPKKRAHHTSEPITSVPAIPKTISTKPSSRPIISQSTLAALGMPASKRTRPIGWLSLPTQLREMIIQQTIPAYTHVVPSHDPSEVIPITSMRAYILRWCGPTRVNKQFRVIARRKIIELNNIGASLSHNAPDDVNAVNFLGMDLLRTVMLDVHITFDMPPEAILIFIANAPNVQHLYLTCYTDPTQSVLPEIWEDDEEVQSFLVRNGVNFIRAAFKIKTIDIDMVCEQNTSKLSPFLAKFVQEAWMNKKCAKDTPILAMIKRVLFQTRPRITISAAQESKTFSNDPFC